MPASIAPRYLAFAVLCLACSVGAQQASLLDSDFDNEENHPMLRRQEPSTEFDYTQRRELWGFSSMLYTVGVCPGPKICGPPPCHGPKPKPDHWHCEDYNNTVSASTSYSTEGNSTVYSAEVADRTKSEQNQLPTSSSNFWMYLAGAAALTALIAGVAYRKRNLSRNIEGDAGEHLLRGSLSKRLGFMRGGSKIPTLPTSPHPSFIEMPAVQNDLTPGKA